MTEPAVTSEAIRFDVLDRRSVVVGELQVTRAGGLRMSNDSTRATRRTVDGVEVAVRPLWDQNTRRVYSGEFDTFTTEVAVVWVRDGTEYPLGIFAWGDESEKIDSYGDPFSGRLVDRSAALDDPIDRNISYPAGTLGVEVLESVANAAGFFDLAIDGSTVALGAPVAAVAGRDTRLQFMETISLSIGFLPPYFDNNGVLTCRSAPDLASADAAFAYGPGERSVTAHTPVRSNDRLSAPNRYQVISGTADFPVVGVYDIPDAAPNSYANTGRYKTHTQDVQGIADEFTAVLCAAGIYSFDKSTQTWLGFTSPPYPDHDTFDLVRFDGDVYREVGWTLDLTVGGQMTHDCRSVYA